MENASLQLLESDESLERRNPGRLKGEHDGFLILCLTSDDRREKDVIGSDKSFQSCCFTLLLLCVAHRASFHRQTTQLLDFINSEKEEEENDELAEDIEFREERLQILLTEEKMTEEVFLFLFTKLPLFSRILLFYFYLHWNI